MMIYRNKKTGQIIDVPSSIGGNWERINDVKVPEKEPSVISEPETVEIDGKEVKTAKRRRKSTK